MGNSSTARFGSELRAYRPKKSYLNEHFRPQDVEILLDQAADLLDRVQRDNTEYQLLGEKLAATEDLIREHQALAAHHSLVGQLLKPEFLPGGGAQVSDLEQRALLSERYSHYQQIDYLVRSMHAYNGAGRHAEAESAGAASTSAHFMSDALQLRRFQEESLAQLRQAVRDARIKRSKAENDALNFSERRANLHQKILADAKAAKDRLIQAQVGLKEFYPLYVSEDSDGWNGLFDVSAPDERPELDVIYFPDDKPTTPKPLMNDYDALHLWTRKAISELVRITRSDQSFSIPVSVKQLLGGSWKSDANEWVLGNIDGLSHQEHTLIRLRGVSLSLVTDASEVRDHDSWKGTLNCRLPASDATPKSVDCFLARVRPWNVHREGDIFGEAVLRNIDPFYDGAREENAAWTLRLDPVSVLGTARSAQTIIDVIVEFHVVAQSVMPQSRRERDFERRLNRR